MPWPDIGFAIVLGAAVGAGVVYAEHRLIAAGRVRGRPMWVSLLRGALVGVVFGVPSS